MIIGTWCGRCVMNVCIHAHWTPLCIMTAEMYMHVFVVISPLYIHTVPRISFDPESYYVNESDGQVSIRILGNRVGLELDAAAVFYTEDISASG